MGRKKENDYRVQVVDPPKREEPMCCQTDPQTDCLKAGTPTLSFLLDELDSAVSGVRICKIESEEILSKLGGNTCYDPNQKDNGPDLTVPASVNRRLAKLITELYELRSDLGINLCRIKDVIG